VSIQTSAAVQSLLEGVPLPAEKRRLLEYARQQPGGEAFAQELERLPDREYRSLDEVGEVLAPVQPLWPQPRADVPRPESGEPPGGEAYVRR
jgi:hypothetical protein